MSYSLSSPIPRPVCVFTVGLDIHDFDPALVVTRACLPGNLRMLCRSGLDVCFILPPRELHVVDADASNNPADAVYSSTRCRIVRQAARWGSGPPREGPRRSRGTSRRTSSRCCIAGSTTACSFNQYPSPSMLIVNEFCRRQLSKNRTRLSFTGFCYNMYIKKPYLTA